MTRTASVTLADHFATFVDVQVADGRYASAEDVVQAALRLLEEQEAHLAALRSALIEGENSGPPSPFDFTAFLAQKRADNVR